MEAVCKNCGIAYIYDEQMPEISCICKGTEFEIKKEKEVKAS